MIGLLNKIVRLIFIQINLSYSRVVNLLMSKLKNQL